MTTTLYARRRFRRRAGSLATWAGIWLLVGLIGWTAASYIAAGMEAAAIEIVEAFR